MRGGEGGERDQQLTDGDTPPGSGRPGTPDGRSRTGCGRTPTARNDHALPTVDGGDSDEVDGDRRRLSASSMPLARHPARSTVDDQQLAMTARQPLRHVRGHDQVPHRLVRLGAVRKRQPDARAASSLSTCLPLERPKRLAVDSTADCTASDAPAALATACDAIPRPGASTATSAAATESVADIVVPLTLTSSELSPGSCARTTAAVEHERDDGSADPARAGPAVRQC